MTNEFILKIINYSICLTLLCFVLTGYAHTYNGSPYWNPPKNIMCYGITDFPNGMKIEKIDEVFGMSFDRYIFAKLAGAMGIYYFDMEMQNSPESNQIKGVVQYFDSTNWQRTEFSIHCIVTEWQHEDLVK
jgi:hypothetical protein